LAPGRLCLGQSGAAARTPEVLETPSATEREEIDRLDAALSQSHEEPAQALCFGQSDPRLPEGEGRFGATYGASERRLFVRIKS
jgi:hypothetical protein